MKIPFFDISHQTKALAPQLCDAFNNFLVNSNFILGPELKSFELEFAEFCDSKYCLGVGNGLDALKLALMALEIGPGDYVVIPAHTFIATALAVLQVGAKPYLVDVDEFFHIDPKQLHGVSDKRVKAVIPVHLYGQPADMDAVNKIAKENSWKVIEDNAQAHGALYKGRKTGSLSDVAACSFYPTKNLGAYGDGGAITCNSEDIFNSINKLRNYGQKEKYNHTEPGINSRLDELQAAFLSIKLKKLPEWTNARNKIASRYSLELEGIGDIIIPAVRNESTHVYHLYVIQTKSRDSLLNYLKESRVDCLIHYPKAIHQHDALANNFLSHENLDKSEAICKEALSLPLYPEMKEEQQEFVIEKIKSFFS